MQQRLLTRLEEIKTLGNDTLATRKDTDLGERVNSGKANGFKSASLSFIEKVYGKNHSYYEIFMLAIGQWPKHPSEIESGLEILSSIEQEIKGDWLFTMKGLVTSAVFADFMEMAEHLMQQNYKDPAAVIIGSVLEEHLRQLCNAKSIDIEYEHNGEFRPKKADRLNADLANREVYTKLDQKNVTAWLGLRNKAAHGEYEEYTSDQVAIMHSSVMEFMTRVRISV